MLALDLALVIRDLTNKLDLSLAARCVAFTLAFRIGTNINTWISQETLSKELGISESNVRVHCFNLKKSGLLEIKKDPDDRRKNLYSFTETIFNYYQMNEEERKKCRLILGDTFEDTAYFQAVNSAQKQAVINCTNGTEVIDNKKEKTLQKSPKEKVKEHKRINKRENSVDNFVLPNWIKAEDWEDFKIHRASLKKPLSNIAAKKIINKLEKLKSLGHDPNYLLERSIIGGWRDVFPPNQPKLNSSLKNETHSTVPWFNDNH